MTVVLPLQLAMQRPMEREAPRQEPLTILHVVQPATVGGIESVIRALAIGHGAAGHRVHVLAVVQNGESQHSFIEALRTNRVPVTMLAVQGRGYARERAVVAALCRELRTDVVHTHGFRPDVVDGGVARRLGVATVSTVHGLTTGGRLRGHVYLLLQSFAHRRFDAVVAVSRVLAEELAQRGIPRKRLHVLPNAYLATVPPLARAQARAGLGIPAAVRRLGWIGRLSREKGPDIFLETLARLRERSVSASILGDGPMRDALRAQASALGIEDRVVFHGTVPDAAQYQLAFDAVVLSSRSEGTPIVLLEAMAAGTPVVATSVGGVPDVMSASEGILVAPNDPDVLAIAIEAVLADPEQARRRAQRAQARIAESFGADAWLDGYVRLYRSLRTGAHPADRSALAR